MQAHSLPMQAAATNRPMMTPLVPVRVFLLSDIWVLRDVFARVLRNQAKILLVGAQEFSADTEAKIIGSACDVLLADPKNMYALDSRVLDRLRGKLSNLKFVTIEMEAGIRDVVLAILNVVQDEACFVP